MKKYNIVDIEIKKNKHSSIVDGGVFVAVFLSSILGAQILGLSLNKIALVPIEAILLLTRISGNIRISKIQQPLILWYLLFFSSSVLGFRINTSLEGQASALILNIVQVVLFYIPLILLMRGIKDLKKSLTKAILLVAKIQALWGLAQFISWHLVGIDINKLLFIDVLKGALGSQWVAWYFDGITTHLRITGLNHDPAYLALILLIGFCYEKNKYWKILYFFVVVIASSRAGIISIALIWIYQNRKSINLRKNKIKYILGAITSILIAIIAFYIVYNRFPSVRSQILFTIDRFSSLSIGSDDGSSRHLLYFITAVEIWLLEFGIIGKLFGIGPRTGGIAITMSSIPRRFSLNKIMQTNAWVIECDFAEVLLGNGILGLVLMYIIYYVIFKKGEAEEKAVMIGFFTMGLMYDVINTTLVQFYLICCISILCELKRKKQI